MGKDLKGKELGVGLSQRKDGLYTARFTDREGKRKQAYFRQLQECRNWIANAQYEDEHGNALFAKDPTVEAWYKYWLNEIKFGTVKASTVDTYAACYKNHIQPYIGTMLLKDVKSIHCKKILSEMIFTKKQSTINLVTVVMRDMFDCAVESEIIGTTPMKNRVRVRSAVQTKKREALTVEEQKKMLSCSVSSIYDHVWKFVLQTGLRTGDEHGKIRLKLDEPSKIKGLS